MMKKTISANAKINLYLDVFTKRSDGYHTIKSIMQTVSLCDIVTVELLADNDKIILECSDKSLPTDISNLAYKAAVLFFEESCIKQGIKITVEKNIPVAGGLAGGSTDAAAVLKILNELFDYPISNNDLIRLSARIGADVPFCLKGGCCICKGIGEELTEINTDMELNVLIVSGGEGVSTPEAYRKIDEKYGSLLQNDLGSFDDTVNSLKLNNKEELYKNAFNIFESVVIPYHSVASVIKEKMIEYGADFTMMSGSGPTIFGVFDSKEKAITAQSHFKKSGFRAFVCKTT